MATDEEIQNFVSNNRELVEKMMAAQKENAEMMKSVGKEVIKMGFSSTYVAAEFARKKSEEFFVSTYKMITDPDVQRHFMASGLEFLAGLTALAASAPMPEFMRTAATGFQRNARAAGCRTNDDCPLKAEKKAERQAEKKAEIAVPAAVEEAPAE